MILNYVIWDNNIMAFLFVTRKNIVGSNGKLIQGGANQW